MELHHGTVIISDVSCCWTIELWYPHKELNPDSCVRTTASCPLDDRDMVLRTWVAQVSSGLQPDAQTLVLSQLGTPYWTWTSSFLRFKRNVFAVSPRGQEPKFRHTICNVVGLLHRNRQPYIWDNKLSLLALRRLRTLVFSFYWWVWEESNLR